MRGILRWLFLWGGGGGGATPDPDAPGAVVARFTVPAGTFRYYVRD